MDKELNDGWRRNLNANHAAAAAADGYVYRLYGILSDLLNPSDSHTTRTTRILSALKGKS